MMKRIQLMQLSTIMPKHRQVLISYQDQDILNDYCQRIIQQHQIEEIESIDILHHQDWENLFHNQQNYRLFPEPKAYRIHFDKASLHAKYLPQLATQTDDLYIFSTPIFKHPLLERLITDHQLEWFGIYAPFNQDLWHFFQTEIKQKGHTLASDIHSWWAENTLTYSQVKQLLEKICLHYPTPQILTLSEVVTHLGLTQHQDIQDLIDAWMNQSTPKIINLLDKIKTNDLVLLQWIIQRNLLVLDALKTSPHTAQAIFQQHKIWPKQTASFIKLNQCLSKDIIAQLLCLLQDVDMQFKTHQIDLAMQKLRYLLLYSASLTP